MGEKITKLSEQLKGKIFQNSGGTFTGQSIRYLKENKVVGWAELPTFSTAYIRMLIAEAMDIEAYDDFEILHVDGVVRGRASQVKGMSVMDIEAEHLGLAEGHKYSSFLKRDKSSDVCSHCGRPKY